ncbi:hypothetical protein AMECASPLE_005424 [Ameca splendens]|uniref:Uncharacterized protein n=1 Tax=Ameca splendens TaxID=208324 RepID=A0ABV1A8K2_9TELE
MVVSGEGVWYPRLPPRADMAETQRWMARFLSSLQRRKRNVGMTEYQFPTYTHLKRCCAHAVVKQHSSFSNNRPADYSTADGGQAPCESVAAFARLTSIREALRQISAHDLIASQRVPPIPKNTDTPRNIHRQSREHAPVCMCVCVWVCVYQSNPASEI